jgi:hypothetical protein
MQDTSDNLGYGNNLLTFGNVMGMLEINVGSDGGPVDAIDDITPTAYEEANGSGSGTLNDIGTGAASQMGIGAKATLPILGAVNFKYVPKADGSKSADNANSGGGTQAQGSSESITIKTNLGDLPLLGGTLDGLTLTTGYEATEVSTTLNTADAVDLTAAVNYSVGNVSLGVQRKYHNEGETNITADEVFYKDLAIGVVYAVNDNLSISYNRYDSTRHDNTKVNSEQSTEAFNIGYTMGGMTIGFQEASTSDAAWVKDAEDDSRTLGVSVAF